MFFAGTPTLPPPGIYPECPSPWIIPGGKWQAIMRHPVIQITKDGLILCAPVLFGSNGTSIPDILPIKREGPWSTHSFVHDASYCTARGWRLEYGNLRPIVLERAIVDESWVEGHSVKRFTETAGTIETRTHAAGIFLFGARAWAGYREDARSLKHAGEVYQLTQRADAAVWDFLVRGVASLEDSSGFAVDRQPLKR